MLKQHLIFLRKRGEKMEKAKKFSLAIQKNTKPIQRNRKKFLKNVVEYLKSDSHMFGPLISPSLSGGKMKKPIKGNKERMLNKVGRYMKSDSYMYAPLLGSTSGQSQFIQKARVEVSKAMSNSKENQSKDSDSAIAKNHTCNGTSERQALRRRETVKHMVHQHCRSLSVKERRSKAMPADLQPKKVAVE